MTQERFLQILQTPDLLAGISYEEIKTLALAYPAVHNFRVLLALKAQQTDHPEFKKQLATAAAYALDRNKLFLMFVPAQIVPVRAPAQEEVLQLKPIEDIRKELESKMPREKAAGAKEKAKAVALDEPVASPIKSDIPEDKLSGPVSAPSNPPAAEASDLSAGMSDLSAGARWISLSQLPMLRQAAENPTAPENPTTAPNSTPEAESAWATSPPKPAAPPAETTAPAPSHTPASEESSGISAQELAERSVRLREVVASETFARLLARQGYTEKAIAMYEKLCLLFPDKSAYFAAEIQKLKK